MTVIEKLEAAAFRASDLSVADDDVLIAIEVRPYGFRVRGHRDFEREVELSIQVHWSHLDGDDNRLLDAVERVYAQLELPTA